MTQHHYGNLYVAALGIRRRKAIVMVAGLEADHLTEDGNHNEHCVYIPYMCIPYSE